MNDTHPRFFRLSALDLNPYASLSILDQTQVFHCSSCGRTRNVYSGVARAQFADRGKAWYDFLHTENGFLLISDSVRDVLTLNSIEGWDSFPVSIAGVESRSLKKKAIPKYHWINVTGQIRVDDSECVIGKIKFCRECRHLEGIKGPDRLVPVEGEVEPGLFTVSNYWFRHIICSYRIIELARQYQWSNCRFQPMDIPQNFIAKSEPIDYLGNVWPPKWYPDGVEPDVRNLE